MKKIDFKIETYNVTVQDLTDYFTKRYFDNADFYWVGGEIGGVVSINDYFFNFSDILDYIKNDYSEYEMFGYYEYALEEATEDRSPINIKNYLKITPSKK